MDVLAGMYIQAAAYDPTFYAFIGGALFLAAAATATLVLWRHRSIVSAMRALEERNEELFERNWELREAEERARSLLEAQGDLIVRRDSFGHITYANDAFCAL